MRPSLLTAAVLAASVTVSAARAEARPPTQAEIVQLLQNNQASGVFSIRDARVWGCVPAPGQPGHVCDIELCTGAGAMRLSTRLVAVGSGWAMVVASQPEPLLEAGLPLDSTEPASGYLVSDGRTWCKGATAAALEALRQRRAGVDPDAAAQ